MPKYLIAFNDEWVPLHTLELAGNPAERAYLSRRRGQLGGGPLSGTGS